MSSQVRDHVRLKAKPGSTTPSPEAARDGQQASPPTFSSVQLVQGYKALTVP